MKKLVALLLISLSVSAMAQHYHHGGYRHGGYGGWGWVAPAVIGGAVVYAATRPQVVVQQPPVVVQQPPVVVQQPPVVMQNPVPIFQEVLKYNSDCQCYVKSYEQIGWK